jgi:hypothetical protein
MKLLSSHEMIHTRTFKWDICMRNKQAQPHQHSPPFALYGASRSHALHRKILLWWLVSLAYKPKILLQRLPDFRRCTIVTGTGTRAEFKPMGSESKVQSPSTTTTSIPSTCPAAACTGSNIKVGADRTSKSNTGPSIKVEAEVLRKW